MFRRLLFGCFVTVCLSFSVKADSLSEKLGDCRGIIKDATRLDCYDALASPVEMSIHGKGSAITEPFQVKDARVLRFNSKDAIMVVYLLDELGEVVKNLHRGGAGEGRYLIENAGMYRIQVNATGDWSLHLELP